MTEVQVARIQSLTGHRDCIYTVQQGEVNNEIFSAGGDGMVVYWQLDRPDEGELIAKLPHSVYALHYCRFNNMLVAGHNYEGIHLLDHRSKKETASLKMTSAAIFDIQSHQKNLFVGTGDGELVVIDIEKLSVVGRVKYSEGSARSIAVCPDRNEMAVGYSDNKIRILDLSTFRLKHELDAHANSVFSVVYTPDGAHLLSGSRDAHLKIWDSNNTYSLKKDVIAHMFAINHIAFSPDGKHFVTCSMDKSIKVWTSDEIKLLKVIDKGRHAGHGTSVNKMVWTSFQNQLVSASDDRTLSVWDLFFKLNNND